MVKPTIESKEDWKSLQALPERLGLKGQFWLCRGAVRCALLRELQPWDDFDLMTDEPTAELASAIDASLIQTSRTFHGGYSFRLATGRKVDLWSLDSTMGRICKNIEEALSLFEFNVDAIAIDIDSGEVVDPLSVSPEIISRDLRILTPMSSTRNAYVAWKAAYFILRHRLVPDESVVELWQQPPSTEGIPSKALVALRKELRLLGISYELNEVRVVAQSYAGLSSYVDKLVAD